MNIMLQLINDCIYYWKPLLWSTIFIVISGAINSKLLPLPINGIYFIIYLFILWLITTWLTFIILQKFFQHTTPLNLEKYLSIIIKKEEFKNNEINNEEINSCVKELCNDIDKYFIKKWFKFISNDKIFNDESKIVIEEFLRKIITVQLHIEPEIIVHGGLNIYLKHLKEFRRSLKRQKKYGGKICEMYEYSHKSSESLLIREEFIYKLTLTLLNNFINWELSTSLPFQVVVSIISKKFTYYFINLLSTPSFLNYFILTSIASEDKQKELNLQNYTRINIKINEYFDENEETKFKIEKSKSNLVTVSCDDIKQKCELRQRLIEDKFEIEANVKIYEPKSCKTWRDSLDLSTVTLGQDILNMINENSDSKEDSSSMIQAKHLLEEGIEGIKTTMKPLSDATIHNIKDLQENAVTNVVKPVSQATTTALHKIGGLQDEAAVVVEGILDFGRMKIRKGLKLTGLECDENKRKLPSDKQFSSDDTDLVWINPLQDEIKIPSITHEDATPDPEYEETADLATSIAKLRSLLEQKSTESNLSTPSLSPMPLEDSTTKAVSSETLVIDDNDGVVPSFYKFCAKTATGVFQNTLNTIKTALPGSVPDLIKAQNNENYMFVGEDPKRSDLLLKMERLLIERRVYCTIDTAYEAIDSLENKENIFEKQNNSTNIHFEDELDDFEISLPLTKTLLDIFCQLTASKKNFLLTQEPIIKTILLFGSIIENKLIKQIKDNLTYFLKNFKIPTETKEIKTLNLNLDEFNDALFSGMPNSLKYVLGEKKLQKTVNLFILSLQLKKINMDIVIQIFEIVCMKLIEGNKELQLD